MAGEAATCGIHKFRGIGVNEDAHCCSHVLTVCLRLAVALFSKTPFIFFLLFQAYVSGFPYHFGATLCALNSCFPLVHAYSTLVNKRRTSPHSWSLLSAQTTQSLSLLLVTQILIDSRVFPAKLPIIVSRLMFWE